MPEFTKTTAELQLVNGSDEHCAYSIRPDDRYTCKGFAVAVLPPNSSAFAHIEWKSTTCENEVVTVDCIFVPACVDDKTSFTSLQRQATEHGWYSASLTRALRKARSTTSEPKTCAPIIATFTFFNKKALTLTTAREPTIIPDPVITPPIVTLPPAVAREIKSTVTEPPVARRRECDLRVDKATFAMLSAPTKAELNKELAVYGIKINNLCVGPASVISTLARASEATSSVSSTCESASSSPSVTRMRAASPTPIAPVPAYSNVTINMSEGMDPSICLSITRASMLTIVIIVALLFYWSFHVVVHFSVQLPL